MFQEEQKNQNHTGNYTGVNKVTDREQSSDATRTHTHMSGMMNRVESTMIKGIRDNNEDESNVMSSGDEGDNQDLTADMQKVPVGHHMDQDSNYIPDYQAEDLDQ